MNVISPASLATLPAVSAVRMPGDEASRAVLRIAVFGIGYVGSVTAATLAARGHSVVAVDLDAAKVDAIIAGRSPVVEPGVDALVRACVDGGTLSATTDAAAAFLASELAMICVGTPSLASDEPDLSALVAICEQLGALMGRGRAGRCIIVRSTVLPGTMESIVLPALERASGLCAGRDFGVGFMPEFLREGQALDDVRDPPLNVCSGTDPATLKMLAVLAGPEAMIADFRTAEALKVASNAWHAVKVCFANEIGALSKSYGVDGRRVMEMVCADSKLNISAAYLRPGFAFGGSCLAKDLRALSASAAARDLSLPLLSATIISNTMHVGRAVSLVAQAGAAHVLLLGLAFKPDTDDLRDSPLVDLAQRLVHAGYTLSIFDPLLSGARLTQANRRFLHDALPDAGSLLVGSLAEGLRRADTVVVGHHDAGTAQLARAAGPHHRIVDLVSGAPALRARADYLGLCW